VPIVAAPVQPAPPPSAAVHADPPHAAKHGAPAPKAAPPVQQPSAVAAPKAVPPAPPSVVQPKAATPSGPTATELTQSAQRELIQGHLAAAADLYAQATRVDPRNEPAWRGLGLANERLGRTADAIRAFQRAIQLAPDGQNAGMLRARLQKLSGAP
jgi:tetratricopeptide (TPR) repeat protein